MSIDPAQYGLTTTAPPSGSGGSYDIGGQTYYFEQEQQYPGGPGLTQDQQTILSMLSDPYMSADAKQIAVQQYQATTGVAPTPGTIGATTAGTSAGVGTAAQRDAQALISQQLAAYGLPPSLADWAWTELVSGKSSNEVLLDLRQRPEFKQAFPEIDARQAAGLAPLSPSDIITYRNEARQLYRAAGLAPGFFDSNAALADLLVKNVSLSELSQRITDAAQEAYNTPPEDRAQFQALGFGHGDLTAMFLNPDVAEPLLHKQWVAAQLSGSGVRSGFGALTSGEALSLTERGVSGQQADQGFATLQHEQQLFNPLDAGETAISRQDQLDAGLGGNAQAQQRIQDRARRRVATFSGGGNFSGSSSGLSGFGSSGA